MLSSSDQVSLAYLLTQNNKKSPYLFVENLDFESLLRQKTFLEKILKLFKIILWVTVTLNLVTLQR